MKAAMDRLSPRQRACLQLVWERQATSKEIAAELGISKGTVDGYIAEATELLGARDRRDAARLAFGPAPLAESGVDAAGVAPIAPPVPPIDPSTKAMPASRPWRSRNRPQNTMNLVQTLGWIAAIAIGSLLALTLATIIGNGLPPVAVPALRAFDRLTH